MSMIRRPRFDPFEVTIALLGAAFFVGLLQSGLLNQAWPRPRGMMVDQPCRLRFSESAYSQRRTWRASTRAIAGYIFWHWNNERRTTYSPDTGANHFGKPRSALGVY